MAKARSAAKDKPQVKEKVLVSIGWCLTGGPVNKAIAGSYDHAFQAILQLLLCYLSWRLNH